MGNSKSLSAFKALLVLACASMTMVGCAQAGSPSEPPTTEVLSVDADSLLIQGYNYTNDYVSSFTVDGQGGGNLYVSGPTSGGGGSVCCTSYPRGTPLPIKLKIKWVGSYCMEYETSQFGRTSSYPLGIWREAEALAVDLSGGKPRALEVHIFPDGHVEAAITRGYSRPRMILPDDSRGLRPGAQQIYPDCTDDQIKKRGR